MTLAASRTATGLVLALASATTLRHVRGAGPRAARHRVERRRRGHGPDRDRRDGAARPGSAGAARSCAPAARQRGPRHGLRHLGRGRRAALLLLRRHLHAGQRRAPAGVHRTRRGGALALAAARAPTLRPDGARRGHRGGRARPRARRGLGRRAEHGRGPVGARRDGRRSVLLRHLRRREQRAAGHQPGRRRAARRQRGARPRRRGRCAAAACRRPHPAVYDGHAVPWWAARPGAGPGDGGVRLRHGDRCRSPARQPARVVRRARRGARCRGLRVAAARRAAARRSRWSAACSCWPGSSWSSWGRDAHRWWPSLSPSRSPRRVSERPAA